MVYQPLEIFVDDETKLTLHGLQQHYVKLEETGKNRKLNELLDSLEFNQVCTLSTSKERDGNLEIGRHLREIRGTGERARQASGFVQLPEYQYPFGACAGGAVRAHWLVCSGVYLLVLQYQPVHGVQGVREAYTGHYRYLRP